MALAPRLGQAKDNRQGRTMDAPTAPPTDATRTPTELFRFSAWLHLGVGADDCEHRGDGSCTNPQHFHAWCRLPNQFQHQDIREKALAAKARRIRQLKDPSTDAYEILESDLEEIRRDRAAMEEEAISKDWWKRHLQAMNEVSDREEYAHIERDRERMAELQAMPEGDRPADEHAELERHMTKFGADVEQRREEMEQPLRDAISAMSVDELALQVREDRIQSEGSAVFMDVYSRWQWLAGTFVSDDSLKRQRKFLTLDALEEAAPEVVESLRELFMALESSLQRGVQGN